MGAIKLVISDVDGTLVTNDKRLTEASKQAVAALAARGIGFTVVSSRPPFGMRMLLEPLSLNLPIGAFNGGLVTDSKLATLEQHLIPRAAIAPESRGPSAAHIASSASRGACADGPKNRV